MALHGKELARFHEIADELKKRGVTSFMALCPRRKIDLHGKQTENILKETRDYAYDYGIRIEFTVFFQLDKTIYVEDPEDREIDILEYKTPETLRMIEKVLELLVKKEQNAKQNESELNNPFIGEFP